MLPEISRRKTADYITNIVLVDFRGLLIRCGFVTTNREKACSNRHHFIEENTTEDCKVAKYIFLIIYLPSCGCNKFYIKMIFNEITKSKDLKSQINNV